MSEKKQLDRVVVESLDRIAWNIFLIADDLKTDCDGPAIPATLEKVTKVLDSVCDLIAYENKDEKKVAELSEWLNAEKVDDLTPGEKLTPVPLDEQQLCRVLKNLGLVYSTIACALGGLKTDCVDPSLQSDLEGAYDLLSSILELVVDEYPRKDVYIL